jgi:hypothetical protein
MSNPPAIYMVLYREVTRADFEKAAAELGFNHFETRPGDGRRVPYEQVWAVPDETTAVNYFEDPISGLNFILLRGAELSRLEMEFDERLHNYDPEETIELAEGAQSHDDQVEAITRLALTWPEYNPQVFKVFEAYATQPPNPLLREATVNAMGYHRWPEFRPLLERIAAQDPAENVRQHAQAILAALPPAPKKGPKGRRK